MIGKRFFSKKPETAASCTLSMDVLSSLVPFNSTPSTQAYNNILAYAQAQGQILKRNKSLFELENSDRFDYYLLEGEVKSIANDGRSEIITSTMAKAKMPLSYLRPRMYQVEIVSKVATFMAVPHPIVKYLYAQVQQEKKAQAGGEGYSDGYSYERVLDPADLETVYAHMREREWSSDDCLMTPLSHSRALWNACVKSKDVDALARAVMQDPSLSARLLKIARSPFYAHLDQSVELIPEAVTLLGRTLCLELIHHFLSKPTSTTRIPALEKLISFVSHRTLQRAEVAKTLATLSKVSFDPQKAYECGLFFRIGDLAMLQSAKEWLKNEAHLSNLQFVAERESLLVGQRLVKAWHLPSYLPELLQNCHATDYASQRPMPNYSELLIAAQLMLCRLVKQDAESLQMTKESPAFGKVMASMAQSEGNVLDQCQQALFDLKRTRMALMAA